MGFSGMVAFSIDPNIRPDLGFFSLLFKEQKVFLSLVYNYTWFSFNYFNC